MIDQIIIVIGILLSIFLIIIAVKITAVQLTVRGSKKLKNSPGTVKILLANDSNTENLQLTSLLQNRIPNLYFFTVHNVQEAINVVEKEPIDIVLFDYELASNNPEHLTENILLKSKRLETTSVIFISFMHHQFYTNKFEKSDFYKFSYINYIMEPSKFEELIVKIMNHLPQKTI